MNRTNEYLIKEYDNKDTKSYQWLEMKGQMEKQNSHGRVKKALINNYLATKNKELISKQFLLTKLI